MEHFAPKKFPIIIMGLFLFTFSSSSLRAQDNTWTTEQITKAEQLGSSVTDHRSLELFFITAGEASGYPSDIVFRTEEQALTAFISASAKKDIHTFYVISDNSNTSRYLDIRQAVIRLLAIENK